MMWYQGAGPAKKKHTFFTDLCIIFHVDSTKTRYPLMKSPPDYYSLIHEKTYSTFLGKSISGCAEVTKWPSISSIGKLIVMVIVNDNINCLTPTRFLLSGKWNGQSEVLEKFRVIWLIGEIINRLTFNYDESIMWMNKIIFIHIMLFLLIMDGLVYLAIFDS